MKKLVLFLFAAMLFSAKANAGQDTWGNERGPLWRSSYTSSADSFVLVASGAIILHMIKVTSATLNVAGSSYVSVFNSTTTNTALYTFSTFTFLSTSLGSTGGGANEMGKDFAYDVPLSSGLVYNKLGAASVQILWDYLIPTQKSIGIP